MTKRTINIIVWALGAIALILILWWVRTDPTAEYLVSMPGADNRGKGLVAQEVKIGEHKIERENWHTKNRLVG